MNEQDEFRTWQDQWHGAASNATSSRQFRSRIEAKASARRKRPTLLWIMLLLLTVTLVFISASSPLHGANGFTQVGALSALMAAWLLAFALRASESFQSNAPAASVKQAINIDLRKKRQIYLAKILAAFALGATLAGLVLLRERASAMSFAKGSAFPLLVLIVMSVLLVVLKRFGTQKDRHLHSLRELDQEFEAADREEQVPPDSEKRSD